MNCKDVEAYGYIVRWCPGICIGELRKIMKTLHHIRWPLGFNPKVEVPATQL
jgi:hypothetical protein